MTDLKHGGMMVDLSAYNAKKEQEAIKAKRIQDIHNGVKPKMTKANINNKYEIKESETNVYHVEVEIKAHDRTAGKYITQTVLTKLTSYTFKKQWDKNNNQWKRNIAQVCKYKDIVHDPTKPLYKGPVKEELVKATRTRSKKTTGNTEDK